MLTIFRKDLAIEYATKEIVTTSGFFAVLVATIASIAFTGGSDVRQRVAPGVIWVAVAFAAVLALSRAWQRERDDGALNGLLVSPISRSAIFAGKALGLSVFLLVIEAIVIPVAAVFFGIDLIQMGPGLIVFCLLVTPGLAASGTLFGAMTVRTRARDLVLAAVMFPLLTPALLAGVAGTRELFYGATVAEVGDYYQLIALFDFLFLAGGLGMFELLIEG
ncbi:MAG: heme exporter protein CcmB [Polyangiaceae bacterium]|nr:heme exporter protein CcmB [Polyangiaceae bacterium]